MSHRKRGWRGFVVELRRRRVFRVATVYAVVGFAVMEAVDIMIPALNLPSEITPLVVVVVIVGFPVALVLAWAVDITPEGLVVTDEVDAAADVKGSGAPTSAQVEPAPFLTRGTWAVVALGLLFVGALWTWGPTAPGEEAGASERPASSYIDSVAVMPLTNLTGNPERDYLGLGITDEIITNLSRFGNLKVTSRHSVQSMAGAGYTIPQIAESLGVRAVVEGSIRESAGLLRATIQFIDGASDAHLWSRTFSAPMGDLDAAQDSIAEATLREVIATIPELDPLTRITEPARGPGQPAYQLGRHWLGRRTPDGLNRAVEAFHEAIALDATHADAYADLSSAYALSLTYRYDIGVSGYTMAARALAMADTAVSLDPERASGYAARGYISTLVNAPLDAILSDFERAAKLQPQASSVASWSARAYELRGDREEAMRQAVRAMELDPRAAGRAIAVAYLSLQVGEYDRSVETASRANELEPDLVLSRAIQARAFLLDGRPEECLALDLGPHEVLRATCLWEVGRRDEALGIVASVEAAVNRGVQRDSRFTPVVDLEDLAVFYAWTGDAERSLSWIRRAYDASPTGLEIRVYESGLFDPSRTPEMESAVAEIRSGLYDRVVAERF